MEGKYTAVQGQRIKCVCELKGLKIQRMWKRGWRRRKSAHEVSAELVGGKVDIIRLQEEREAAAKRAAAMILATGPARM